MALSTRQQSLIGLALIELVHDIGLEVPKPEQASPTTKEGKLRRLEITVAILRFADELVRCDEASAVEAGVSFADVARATGGTRQASRQRHKRRNLVESVPSKQSSRSGRGPAAASLGRDGAADQDGAGGGDVLDYCFDSETDEVSQSRPGPSRGPRVYEIAKDLGVPSRTVLDAATRCGLVYRSSASVVELRDAYAVIDEIIKAGSS